MGDVIAYRRGHEFVIHLVRRRAGHGHQIPQMFTRGQFGQNLQSYIVPALVRGNLDQGGPMAGRYSAPRAPATHGRIRKNECGRDLSGAAEVVND